MGVHPVDAPEVGDELARRLGTDAGHAGDVVAGVPHQRQHVDHLMRLGDAELGGDVVGAQHLRLHRGRAPASRIQDAHVGTEKLVEVLVAGHRHDVQIGPGELDRERPDHVVRLHPVHHHQRAGPGLDQLPDPRDLHAQLLGHLGAVGLVLGKLQVAKRGAGRIEHHRHVVGLLLDGDELERVGEAEHRSGGLALRNW